MRPVGVNSYTLLVESLSKIARMPVVAFRPSGRAALWKAPGRTGTTKVP
ncbi:hypothetical protein ACFPRL_27290 [Pseudoclavibacter helvolus]